MAARQHTRRLKGLAAHAAHQVVVDRVNVHVMHGEYTA